MKKADRIHSKPDLFETAEPAVKSNSSVKFNGTDNPRYLRVIHALRVRPISREQLDRIAGCSNGPALVAKLRDLGLGKVGLPCTKVPDHDRDGFPIRRGVYFLSDVGRRAIYTWLRKRKGGAN